MNHDKRLYSIWHNMKTRCNNIHASNFKYYGAKGIKVCKEWSVNFQSFKSWAMNNGYKDNLQIDRINNNKGYEPNNCRWVSKFEQEHNKSTNRYITYHGETKIISDWARKFNIDRSLLRTRLTRGWSFEDAIKPRKWKKTPRKNHEEKIQQEKIRK